MQAIILSGGSGSRLWPLSSKTAPKPFIKMDDGQSLLQKTLLRASNIDLITNIITVAHHNFISQIQEEYEFIKPSILKPLPLSFILEPCAKNTAAAIASASLLVQKYYDKDETMLVLPSDHLISDQPAFKKAIIKAQNLALDDNIVTFGIKPDRPETGYGYIEHDSYTVKRFVEKPTLKVAQEYITQGNFLWNSGILCFKPGTMIEEMEKHCPDILNNVRLSIDLTREKHPSKITLNFSTFNLTPKKSIDYAIMEKSKHIKVVPCNIGWRDIGTWSALSKLSPVDSDGNNVKGKAKLHNVTNCYIENTGQSLGVVGVNNLAIINTKNGFLITNKKNSEEVRNIYSQIQNDKDNIQDFAWGRIKIIQDHQNIQISQIEINPHSIVEISNHIQHSANWMVIQGCAQFLIKNQTYNLKTHESKYLPIKNLPKITNLEKIPLILIAIELDDYLLQNDIVPPMKLNKVSEWIS